MTESAAASTSPRLRLTSLLLVEERLLEAEYFVRRMSRQRDHLRFGYDLNAYLSSARSVTFLLQKEMSKVAGFDIWWQAQREVLGKDASARFFLRLRNFSQKEGRVSFVSGGLTRQKKRRASHRFAGTEDRVPKALLNHDVADCCREHLAKLARLVLACTDSFPYHTCPRRALTPEGIDYLGLSLGDVEEVLGFPRNFTAIAEPHDRDRRIGILRAHVDGLDFQTIRRISRLKSRLPRPPANASDVLSEDLLTSLVDGIEQRKGRFESRELVLSLMQKSWPPDQGIP